jgi:hypothetical protein
MCWRDWVSVARSGSALWQAILCALEGGVNDLVAEDARLRQLKYYHGTPIVGLEQFRKEVGI